MRSIFKVFQMKLFCDSTILSICTNSTRLKIPHNYSFQHMRPVPKSSAHLWSSSPQTEYLSENTQICTEGRGAGWSCESIFNNAFQRANFYKSRKKPQWLKHLFVVKVSQLSWSPDMTDTSPFIQIQGDKLATNLPVQLLQYLMKRRLIFLVLLITTSQISGTAGVWYRARTLNIASSNVSIK